MVIVRRRDGAQVRVMEPCQQDHSKELLSLDPPLNLVTIKLHNVLWSIPDCSHRREPPTDISFPRRRCVWGAGRCCEYICHHINQVISTKHTWFLLPPGCDLSDSLACQRIRWFILNLSFAGCDIQIGLLWESLLQSSHGMSHMGILPHRHSDYNTK